MSCSALKRAYRRLIMSERPDVRLVYLRGDRDAIASRLAARTDHFMPPSLLDSQFAAIEEPGPDERPIVVDASRSIDEIVAAVTACLRT